jgi:hypothetical protein
MGRLVAKDANQLESGYGRHPCVGCGHVHGSENGHINCLNSTVVALRQRLKDQDAVHNKAIEQLKVANRAAVEAALLSVSKGGQSEALQTGSKG